LINKLSLLFYCILLLGGCSKVDSQTQGKIISVNPCTDAILLELADVNQIGAISHYSHDPNSSSTDIMKARKFLAIGQSAEEIIAAKPSLVLAGGHMSSATLQALKKRDIKILQYPVANTIEQSHEQIRSIAKAIGKEERGKTLIAQIERTVIQSAVQARENAQYIPALIWQGGGLVPGKGTLIDELLTHTGFENSAQQYGLSQWDIIGLERLSSKPPAIILRGGKNNDRILQHPIIKKINTQVESFPQSLIWCAGPTIAQAVEKLADIRKRYTEQNNQTIYEKASTP